MSVAFELIEAPYPYVCAVYTCECGASVTQHGDQAATTPPSWQVTPTPAGDLRAICPTCCAAAPSSLPLA
jgi:hypothetical protein